MCACADRRPFFGQLDVVGQLDIFTGVCIAGFDLSLKGPKTVFAGDDIGVAFGTCAVDDGRGLGESVLCGVNDGLRALCGSGNGINALCAVVFLDGFKNIISHFPGPSCLGAAVGRDVGYLHLALCFIKGQRDRDLAVIIAIPCAGICSGGIVIVVDRPGRQRRSRQHGQHHYNSQKCRENSAFAFLFHTTSCKISGYAPTTGQYWDISADDRRGHHSFLTLRI